MPGGAWTKIANQPPFRVNTALLVTDGTVICQEDCGFRWSRLTPEEHRQLSERVDLKDTKALLEEFSNSQ